MDIKQVAIDTAKSAKFEGVHFFVKARSDSRLEVNIDATASIDLPGDLDAVVANIFGLLGLGNSPASSPSSGG